MATDLMGLISVVSRMGNRPTDTIPDSALTPNYHTAEQAPREPRIRAGVAGVCEFAREFASIEGS